MADRAQEYPFPDPRLAVEGMPGTGLGYKSALLLALLGAGAAALLFCAHAVSAGIAAVVILALSAAESEPFLLLVIFLTPLAATLKIEARYFDGPTALHALVIVGFFLGRLGRGDLNVRRLLSSLPARASLLVLGAIAASLVLPRGGWTESSVHSLYRMGVCVGFFFVVLGWADRPERVRKILHVLLYSTIATALFALLQEVMGGYTAFWLYFNPPGDFSSPWEGRASSFLNYSNSAAGYLNLALPLALACGVLAQGKWRRLGRWAFGLGSLALLSTQSIGGLMAFVCILVLAILYFARSPGKALGLLAAICTLVGLIYVLRALLNPTHTQEVIGPDALIRLLLWGTAWSYFVHSPIFGVGWGNFVLLYGTDLSSFSDLVSPGRFDVHNIYLKFLAETGLVGFIAFGYLVVQSWREARHRWCSSPAPLDKALAFGVLGALVSMLVHGVVDVFFQVSPEYGTLFWLLLALLVAAGVQHRSGLLRSS